jgi:hypothetical protein
MRRSSVTASSRPVKRNRLERKERNLLGIVERELDDAAHLLVIDAVDDGDDGHDVDAVGVQVFDGAQLHVEQVADLAVRVGGVADAIELQVGVAQAGVGGLCGRIPGSWRTRCRWWRPARWCSRPRGRSDTASRKYGEMVGSPPENCTDIWRLGLMVMALSSSVLMSSQVSSCTKPTWLASMKHGSHIMLQRLVRSMVSTEPRPWVMVLAVIVQPGIVVGADVAAGEALFQVLEEGGVDGHHVLEVAVNGAILDHQDLAVALDDLGFDLAHLFVHQDRERLLAVENLLADLGDAARAQGIGLARPAQRGLGLLVRLEQRLFGPLRDKRRDSA